MNIIAARNWPLSHIVAELNWQSNRTRLYLEFAIFHSAIIYRNRAWCTTRWARSRSSNYIMKIFFADLFDVSSVSPDTVSRFYAFLFRRLRGGKYRNNCVWVEAKPEAKPAPGSSIDCNKGRYGTTRLSQRRARGPIRR